jgi:hypothetical protein
MMWMLARLYHTLPEAGDLEKPKLVFFFDEAHLLFEAASPAFKEQVEQVARLIRSKGVGVFFVTQSPKDVPADILAQLGNRVQHALRAYTPDDDKALRAAARTFPKTAFYDVEETLTTLGIGEALVTVLNTRGIPTPPFAVRLIPPSSRMSPLTEAEMRERLSASAQVREYATSVDRESAREMLAARAAEAVQPLPDDSRGKKTASTTRAERSRAAREPRSALEEALHSPVARTIAGVITRGLMGALLGGTRRRRR